MINKLNSLEVEYQELSDNELETVVGGTFKSRQGSYSYTGYGNGGYGNNGGGDITIVNNNTNNNNSH